MSEKEICEEIPKRVVISDASVPFVARGGRVFSRQVLHADPGIKDGDIVRVIDRNEHLLSTAYVFIGP
jgi:archaeosine-15-forming tRNA-guanine transglycosylase